MASHTFCASAPKFAKLTSPQSRGSPPLHFQREMPNKDQVRARSSSIRISQERGDDTIPYHASSKRLSMFAEKGYSWKAAKARLPTARHVLYTVRHPRFLLLVGMITIAMLLWRSMSSAADEMQRFVCWGPSKSPLHMTPNENEDWMMGLGTPIIFNHHKPIEVNATDIEYVNLNMVKSSIDAASNNERVLILTPLRDASSYLAKHFDLLTQMTYPHELIDLAFLVGDSTDDTLAALAIELERVQSNAEVAFRSTMIVEKSFGIDMAQTVEERHAFKNQGPRRKAMGRARNYLLASALKPEHSWVYWRDVDIIDSPLRIIEDLTSHDRDIIVPNVWFHRYEEQNGMMIDIEGRFDYNNWQESPEALQLAASLDKNDILAEGYAEYPTNRKYMATMGDWRKDKDVEIALDGIGGVSVMVKADVHRSGVNFPCYSFENQAETEGFAKMAKRAGYGVYGLPNYVVWHIDTEEQPGNLKPKEK